MPKDKNVAQTGEKKQLKTFADLYKVSTAIHEEQALQRKADEQRDMIEEGLIPSVLDVSLIDPDPNQPRKFFSKTSLEDLTNSIRERGVDTPIIVRPASGGRYKIVAGERRFRGSIAAGLKSIPVTIKEYNDAEAYIAALTENIQREDLHYLDESEAFKSMIDQGYVKDQVELAERLGKSKTYVTYKFKILTLPQKIKDLIYDTDGISFTHARFLAQIQNEETAYQYAKKIVKGELTVQRLEELIASGAPGKGDQPRPKSSFQPVQMRQKSNGFDMTIKYRKDRPEDIIKIINIFKEKIIELESRVNNG
jgi:ParB family chromosome partitioning protein